MVAIKKKINFIGFLDDNKKILGKKFSGYPVLGNLSWLKRNKKIFCNNSIASSMQIRKEVTEKINKYKPKFYSLIDPSINISNTKIEKGVTICSGSNIGHRSHVKSHTIICNNVNIGHDVNIGSYCFFAAGSSVLGKVKVSDGCYIGSNSSCYPGIKIGKWSTVGMSSAIISNVESYTTYLGVPAKKVWPK